MSWILKKLNLLRVPPEVELEGLDLAEFGQDFYPEFERVPEVIVEPDGREVDAADVLLDAYQSNERQTRPTKVGGEEGGAMFDSFPYDEWSDTVTDFWTFGGLRTRPGRTS